MKTHFLKAFVFLVLAGILNACNEPLVEEATDADPLLKSAQSTKISYIVVLNDTDLEIELANLKGYEMRQQVAKRAAEKVLNRAAVADGELGFVYSTALKGFSVKIPPGQLKKLENDPSVVRIEEDQIITLIEPFAKLNDGDMEATSTQSTPWGITRVKGGINYTGTSVAWVIDSGIDLDHPDLNVDASRGAVFVRADSPDDDNGHGSHVAGTIAARDNAEGVIGVAAGATVIPVKVLDRRGSGSYSGVIAGVDFVATNGKAGDVANMSLGGPPSQTLDDAVVAASNNGIKFILAAGNESDDANNHSPARANGTYIYTISAMDVNDNFASFSNFKNPPVDYCAPGVSVYSTYKNGGYTTYSGTSMAAPHVAGLLLLGKTKTEGYVKNDPDGEPDPIMVYDGTGNVAPTASFTYAADGLTVQFTDASKDSDGTIASRSWNFGDTNTSTQENPSHTYATEGTFTVTLTVTDDDGTSSTTSQDVTVSSGTTNNPPTADFSFTTNNLTATFADKSSDTDGSVVGWSWNFGDSSTSTAQNPSHTYTTSGTYTVSLSVTDDDGETTTASKSVTVSGSSTNEPPVVTNFSLTNTSNPALKRVQVSWSVTDSDGDLKTVETQLSGPGTASATTAVSGSSASGVHELSVKKGSSGLYTVTLTVTDIAGNSKTETADITL